MELQRNEQKTNTDLKLNSAGVKFLERYQREKVEEMVDTAKIAPETVKILNALTLGLESLTLDSIFSSAAKGKNDNRLHDRLPGATKEQSKADQDDIALTKEIEEFMSTVLESDTIGYRQRRNAVCEGSELERKGLTNAIKTYQILKACQQCESYLL